MTTQNSARYGYGPNGRALKKDGTERKARTTLSPAEQMEKMQEQFAKVYGKVGKALISECENLSDFNSGIATFQKQVRECKAIGTPEKREARKAYYLEQISLLDSKGAAAEEFLPKAEQVSLALASLYSDIGKEYQELQKAGEVSPEETEEMIVSEISEEMMEMVTEANNPEADPLKEFRRDRGEDDTEDDTL